MLVGVISDTHGYMDPRALHQLQGVDHILHAGDIGDERIIDELERIADVTTVRGNVDREGAYLAESTRANLRIGGQAFLPDPRVKTAERDTDLVLDEYRQSGIEVVVYGHSHIAYQQEWGNILFFNPARLGSAASS